MNCKIMGILNVTEDSFFDGGRYLNKNEQVERIGRMVAEGVDIIDVGAMSTRPGATEVVEVVEYERIENIIELIKEFFPSLIISVDTYRASVAKMAIEHGVHYINDISGGLFDGDMFDTVALSNVGYVMMHTSGKSDEMQSKTSYDDVLKDIMLFFERRISLLTDKGFNNIIIDPGFGFGKTLEQNYKLLSHLDEFKKLGYPVLVGMSRKSMVYRALGLNPDDALNGTTVVNTVALLKGVDFLRVHDVKEAVQAKTLVNLL